MALPVKSSYEERKTHSMIGVTVNAPSAIFSPPSATMRRHPFSILEVGFQAYARVTKGSCSCGVPSRSNRWVLSVNQPCCRTAVGPSWRVGTSGTIGDGPSGRQAAVRYISFCSGSRVNRDRTKSLRDVFTLNVDIIAPAECHDRDRLCLASVTASPTTRCVLASSNTCSTFTCSLESM